MAPSMAPCRTPSDSAAWSSAGISASAPASANSAVNTGSRLIRSIDGSSADSRRSSWMRCSDALVGSSSVSTVYSSVLHRSAMPAWPNAPLKPAGGFGSGLMYHVSVGVPLSSPPHPSNNSGAAIATAATIPIRWRATGSCPLQVRRPRNRDTSAPLSKHPWPRRDCAPTDVAQPGPYGPHRREVNDRGEIRVGRVGRRPIAGATPGCSSVPGGVLSGPGRRRRGAACRRRR